MPEPVPVCTARAGRMQRLVVGADSVPDVPFFQPDAPTFTRDPAPPPPTPANVYAVGAFSIKATQEPFAIDVDVGDAQIFGFGAATGKPALNGARFRVMTVDTTFFGLTG